MKVPASAFALPTGSAIVTEALFVAPYSTSAAPVYCRVRATIAATQASDPSILYQINLPSRWNLKMVGYGGGGLNGVLIEASGAFKGGDDLPSALARGYVSYGGAILRPPDAGQFLLRERSGRRRTTATRQ